MKPALKPGYLERALAQFNDALGLPPSYPRRAFKELGHWTQDLIWRNAKQMQEEDSDGEA